MDGLGLLLSMWGRGLRSRPDRPGLKTRAPHGWVGVTPLDVGSGPLDVGPGSSDPGQPPRKISAPRQCGRPGLRQRDRPARRSALNRKDCQMRSDPSRLRRDTDSDSARNSDTAKDGARTAPGSARTDHPPDTDRENRRSRGRSLPHRPGELAPQKRRQRLSGPVQSHLHSRRRGIEHHGDGVGRELLDVS